MTDATVTSATLVSFGAPIPDGSGGTLKLPGVEAWNSKFEGTGNGGYSGALDYAAMQRALADGHATAGFGTGHPGDDLKFVVGHPGKIDDRGWRAVHVMLEDARSIVHWTHKR